MAVAVEDFIAHYGVKGMKWGVKNGAGGGGKKAVEKEAYSEDAAKVSKTHTRVATQKSTKMLSNKELQDAITRMNLEQQYSRMTNGLDKTRKQKSREFIRERIQEVTKMGGQQASNFANDQMKSVIERQSKTGRFDPNTVAKRNLDLVANQNKLREEQRKAATA